MAEHKIGQNFPKNNSQLKPIGDGVLPCIYKASQYEISDGGNYYRIVCYKNTLSIRLNRILKRYPPGAVFRVNDEVLFTVKKHQTHLFAAIKNALRVKGD